MDYGHIPVWGEMNRITLGADVNAAYAAVNPFADDDWK